LGRDHGSASVRQLLGKLSALSVSAAAAAAQADNMCLQNVGARCIGTHVQLPAVWSHHGMMLHGDAVVSW
jgi:hypothetical protein